MLYVLKDYSGYMLHKDGQPCGTRYANPAYCTRYRLAAKYWTRTGARKAAGKIHGAHRQNFTVWPAWNKSHPQRHTYEAIFALAHSNRLPEPVAITDGMKSEPGIPLPQERLLARVPNQ